MSISKMCGQRLLGRLNIGRTAGVVFCLAMISFCGTAIWAQETGEAPSFGQGGFFDAGPSTSGGFADPAEALNVTASFSLAPQKPGSENDARQGAIFVTADIAPGWHIYSTTQPAGALIATTITVAPSDDKAYGLTGKFKTNVAPEKKTLAAFGGVIAEMHHGKLTWRAPLKIAAGVDPSTLEIRGMLRSQACTDNSCLPPKSYQFVARFSPDGVTKSLDAWTQDNGKTATGSTTFDPGKLKIAANEELAAKSMIVIVLMSFAGGFILNLMPCVLPVVGLKLLAFVEQSGQSRSRIFMLNFWYSLGLMSVFMLLATLAMGAGKSLGVGEGWGALFQNSGFTITLAAVVFVMALSFFDVWEIPIPGFAVHGKATELSQREGVSGAFSKGVLTTFLATPCTAPLLAPALAWTTSRSPLEVYTVFFFIGLGMAFPYLLIGAFPKLIRFLPKPGDWMETFKHLMGFLLLGTVVYLLTTLYPAHAVPAIALLFGLWGACWWVGRVPHTANRQTKIRSWLQAAIFTGIIVIVAYPGIDEVVPKRISVGGIRISFGGIHDVMNHRLERLVEKRLAQAGILPAKETTEEEIVWLPFTRRGLDERLAQGETVLVDFTADWCPTCKVLEAAVLNTSAVRKALMQNNVVAMQADWTHGDPEITKMLKNLRSIQVPVIAIFPADRPNQPFVFSGGCKSGELIKAIEEAAIKK